MSMENRQKEIKQDHKNSELNDFALCTVFFGLSFVFVFIFLDFSVRSTSFSIIPCVVFACIASLISLFLYYRFARLSSRSNKFFVLGSLPLVGCFLSFGFSIFSIIFDASTVVVFTGLGILSIESLVMLFIFLRFLRRSRNG